MDVVSPVVILFLLILLGYVGRKTDLIADEAVSNFSALVVNISLPALIFNSLQREFSPELLALAGRTLLLSFALYALAFGIAFLWTALVRPPLAEKAVHEYALVFSNVGFMGFPLIEALMGKEALFALSILNVPFNLLAFSLGAWLLARHGKRPVRMGLRQFFNPCVIATLLGFVFFLFSWPLPGLLFQTLGLLGNTTSPLSMLIIGAVLARMPLREVFGRWRIYATSLVRIVVVPAISWALLYVLGVRDQELMLPVMAFAMPVAANTTLVADYYQGDSGTAGALVFLSSLGSVFTIPLVASLLR